MVSLQVRSRRRRRQASLGVGVVLFLVFVPQVSQALIPPEDPDISVVTAPPGSDSGPTTTTTTLPSAATTIPPGCPVPQEASVVFVGTVSAIDVSTATYVVDQVRYGTLETVVIGQPVNVRYGSDAKYVKEGTQYLVGAVIDPASLVLSSTVRDTPTMFGGAAVASAIAQGQCPELEAAVRTLFPDGTSIESGVLTPFFESGWRIAIALILPAILGFVLLLALVWIRRGTQK